MKTLAAPRRRLFEARQNRPRPHRDDKTIVRLERLTISAFARAGAVLDEPRYGAAAVRAARSSKRSCTTRTPSPLWRVWRDGRAPVGAFLDDHAFLIQGLLDLYDRRSTSAGSGAVGAPGAAGRAVPRRRARRLFQSADGGGATSVFRLKDDHEGAEPAANSVAALNLLRISPDDRPAAAREAGAAHLQRVIRPHHRTPAPWRRCWWRWLFTVEARADRGRGDPEAADTRALLKGAHALTCRTADPRRRRRAGQDSSRSKPGHQGHEATTASRPARLPRSPASSRRMTSSVQGAIKGNKMTAAETRDAERSVTRLGPCCRSGG